MLLTIEPSEAAGVATVTEEQVDLDAIRPDLAEVLSRRALTLDAKRPEATARRRKTKPGNKRLPIASLPESTARRSSRI